IRRGLPSPRLEQEARRMRGALLFAQGDYRRSAETFEQMANDEALPEARRGQARDWLALVRYAQGQHQIESRASGSAAAFVGEIGLHEFDEVGGKIHGVGAGVTMLAQGAVHGLGEDADAAAGTGRELSAPIGRCDWRHGGPSSGA